MKKQFLFISLLSVLLMTSCQFAKDNTSTLPNENSQNNNNEEINNNSTQDTSTNENVKKEDSYLDKLLKEPDSPTKEVYSINNEINKKINKFNYDLLNKLYTQDESNVAISPVSIYMALSLAAECANNDTRDEIIHAFNLENIDENKSFFKSLYANICYTKGYQELIREISNSIWLNQYLSFKDNCLETLANDYYCYPFGVDFTNPNTNKLMGDFIKDKTHDLININPNISPQAAFVLLNTLYLKDAWGSLELQYTDEKFNFRNYNGSISKTELLKGAFNTGKVYENDIYKSFYTTTSSNMKLTFVVPQDGYSVDDLFKDDILYNVNYQKYITEDENSCYYTRTYFPKFEASFDKDIKEELKDLGIKSLFNSDCDLSNVIDEDEVVASAVRHVTKYKVDEKGTEGAAVTIIEVETTAVEGPTNKIYDTFVVDKSFAYILSTPNNVPLFAGAVKII